MKRLIKYADKYAQDAGAFSNCSTEYEVLQFILPDETTNQELKDFVRSLGYETTGQVFNPIENSNRYRPHGIRIEQTIKLKGTVPVDQGVYFKGNTELRPQYVGLITVPDVDGLEPRLEDPIAIPKDLFYELVNNQCMDFYGTATIDSEHYLIKEGWDSMHYIELYGYSIEDTLKELSIDWTTFSDEVSSCSNCGEYMFNDNGYTYNYRIVDCDLLGIECGCFEHYQKNNLDSFIATLEEPNKTPMELDVAEELEESGVLEHLERFIGGMVDGRGGYFNGESTREGSPESVLKEYLNKYPDSKFLFTHDESGQFQTYFSIWRVRG